MLTSRGWWFLLVVLALLTVAVFVTPRGHIMLGVIGLTLLFWFLGQWVLFALRAGRVLRGLKLEREVQDDRGPVQSLWAGRTFKVHLRLSSKSVLGLPHVRLKDRVPAGINVASGRAEWEGGIATDRPAELDYSVHCTAVGRMRWEGARVELADLQGFFYHAGFVSEPQVYRVLPMLVDAEGRGPATKRHNLLPPPGVHRLRRPGSGSELLDLRDYFPGDPPRTIAWKVSARRDRLITKEFESEVPVRCTLFVDTSNSVRLGSPGQNALARQVEIAAAVAQATVSARDLVGLCLFDEKTANYTRPARTPQHLARLLNTLADAAGLAPTEGKASPDALIPLAYSFAHEVYPHLLRRELNQFPFWLPWLAPQPPRTRREPTFADYLYRAPAWFLMVYVAAWLLSGISVTLFVSDNLLHSFIVAGVLTAALVAFGLMVGVPLFLLVAICFPHRRRQARWRKQLAAILSVHYGLQPGGLAMLTEDDEQFAVYCQRFLAEHQVPYQLPLYDRRGRYLFAAPEKVEVLSRALLRAVRLSHDNELFVLLADLLEVGDSLGPLLRAVKVALARHHQVLVVCPWPPGVEPPPAREREPESSFNVSLPKLLEQATTMRFHESFFRLRQSFARIGVPVVCARGDDPVPLIVDRLDRLRTVRFRASGGR